MKIELRTITCANVQFRVQRQLVDLESRHVTLSMNRDFTSSNQFPLDNSNVLSILVEKGRGWVDNG